MHSKVNSVHGDYYCELFGKQGFFVEAYPIEKNLGWHEALDKFVNYYGMPESMIYDGAQEQDGQGTKFQAKLRKKRHP